MAYNRGNANDKACSLGVTVISRVLFVFIEIEDRVQIVWIQFWHTYKNFPSIGGSRRGVA